MKKILLGALLAIFSISASVGILVAFDRLYGRFHGMEPNPYPYSRGENHYLGWVPLPKVDQHHRREVEGKLLYDVWYHIDEFHRRVTKRPHGAPAPKQYALFFVDSNTFGEGLWDSQTIPSIFAERLPQFRSYNYSYRGYGPQQMLGRLEMGFAPGEISEESGIGIYVFYDHHISRANGILPEIAWAGGRHSSYKLTEGNTLEHQGTFDDTHPWRSKILWLLGKSYFLRTRWEYITPWQPEHYEHTCAIILESRNRFEKLNTKNKFFVFLPPNILPKSLEGIRENCLVKYKIQFFQIAYPKGLKNKDLVYPSDFHWNPEGARWIATEMARMIQEYFDRQKS